MARGRVSCALIGSAPTVYAWDLPNEHFFADVLRFNDDRAVILL